MSIYKRKDTKNYYYRFEVNKRPYQGSCKTADEQKALEFEATKRQEIEDLLASGKKPVTLHQALTLYRDHYTTRALSSHKAICSRVKKLLGQTNRYINDKKVTSCYALADADMPFEQLTELDINKLIDKRFQEGNAAQTIKHEVILIRQTVKFCKQRGFQAPKIDWEEVLSVVVDNTKERFLDDDEVAALLYELHPDRERKGLAKKENRSDKLNKQILDNYEFAIGLLFSGLRYSELAELQFKSVDFEDNTITIKRKKKRANQTKTDTLEQPEAFMNILKRRLAEAPKTQRYVFTDETGKQARKHSTSALQKAIDRAGLNDDPDQVESEGKVVPHTLRHTHASHLIGSGELSLYELQKVMNHASSKTTERYAHLVQSHVSKKKVKVLDKKVDKWLGSTKTVEETEE